MATSRRARLLGLAVLVLSFVAGALAGAATMQVVGADEARAFGRSDRGRHGPPLLDRLGLTAEQREPATSRCDRIRAHHL